jgi:hypothetical protein
VEYKPDEMAQESYTLSTGQIMDVSGAEYICKNKRVGCCKL